MKADPNNSLPLINEPLEMSAPLAWSIAQDLCYTDPVTGTNCSYYHGVWQYLRLLKVITSIRSDSDFLLYSFRRLARLGKTKRIMIVGAADYGLLVHLVAAFKSEGVTPQITVLDICETPLFLNKWYGDLISLPVRVVQSDVLKYESVKPYDMICTHSFIHQVPSSSRPALISKWKDFLKPGGKVVTAQRIRPKYPHDQNLKEEAIALRQKVLLAANNLSRMIDIEAETLADAAFDYAIHKRGKPLRSVSEIRELFEGNGFSLKFIGKAPKDQSLKDLAKRPYDNQSKRLNIIATRV